MTKARPMLGLMLAKPFKRPKSPRTYTTTQKWDGPGPGRFSSDQIIRGGGLQRPPTAPTSPPQELLPQVTLSCLNHKTRRPLPG